MNIKLPFFLLIPMMGFSQLQIGQSIYGEAPGDVSGASVDISANGRIIAIGAPGNDNSNGFGAGHVRIYENVLGDWIQIGQDIDGENDSDGSGNSVSLSADGNIVAIASPGSSNNGFAAGHVRVFENILGVWTQMGNNIEGQGEEDYSSSSVFLSANGNVVAIAGGAGVYSTGYVRIYENVLGDWVQIGQDINGENMGDAYNGQSISLSENGNIIAIGSPSSSNENGEFSGQVRVYEFIEGVWTQIGQDIMGESEGDNSGYSVSISSNGNILAIGAHYNGGNGTESGHVRIYENILGEWIQVGQDIDGEAFYNWSGFSVSLSADGKIIAIGAPANDTHGNGNGSYWLDYGHVRIYENILGEWIQVGQDIDGENMQDTFGWAVSLSADGKTVIAGAPSNHKDGTEHNIGQVRIYDISDVLSKERFLQERFNIYPNPTAGILNISLDDNLSLEQVIIYNSLGHVVFGGNKRNFDVNNLANGVYFLEVITDYGRATKKLIVKK